MIKQILRDLDYGIFAEISLVMFLCIFLVVSVRTVFKDTQGTKRCANVVFDENEVNE